MSLCTITLMQMGTSHLSKMNSRLPPYHHAKTKEPMKSTPQSFGGYLEPEEMRKGMKRRFGEEDLRFSQRTERMGNKPRCLIQDRWAYGMVNAKSNCKCTFSRKEICIKWWSVESKPMRCIRVFLSGHFCVYQHGLTGKTIAQSRNNTCPERQRSVQLHA